MRDFQRTQKKNPHVGFVRFSRSRRILWRVGLVSVLVLGYLLGTMPPLQFSHIEVVASTEQGRDALREQIDAFLNARAFGIFPNRSVLVFRRSRLEQNLRATLPIESVSVASEFRKRALQVRAAYRIPVARIQFPNETLYVRSNGNAIFARYEPYEESSLLLIQSSSARNDTTILLSENDLLLYRALKTYFEKTSTPIVWMILRDDPDVREFQMKDGWTLRTGRFDQAFSLINRLTTFFQERKREQHPLALDYIDLRFGDKVVYKERAVN